MPPWQVAPCPAPSHARSHTCPGHVRPFTSSVTERARLSGLHTLAKTEPAAQAASAPATADGASDHEHNLDVTPPDQTVTANVAGEKVACHGRRGERDAPADPRQSPRPPPTDLGGWPWRPGPTSPWAVPPSAELPPAAPHSSRDPRLSWRRAANSSHIHFGISGPCTGSGEWAADTCAKPLKAVPTRSRANGGATESSARRSCNWNSLPRWRTGPDLIQLRLHDVPAKFARRLPDEQAAPAHELLPRRPVGTKVRALAAPCSYRPRFPPPCTDPARTTPWAPPRG